MRKEYDFEKMKGRRNPYAKHLKKNAAIADEDITVKEYGADLDANLERLVERLKQKRYRAKLIKRRYIPKQNGKKSPLGTPTVNSYCTSYCIVLEY